MAVLPIRTAPDPILAKKAQKIKVIDDSLRRLIDDMVETMHAANGVGIAANQVGSLRKVAVIHIPDEDNIIVLINPEIVRREGERELDEGCLSIPGYRGVVKRSVKVEARALDINGRPYRIKAEDNLLAQALEHEIDHLNGTLYITHLRDRNSLHKIEPQEQADGAAESEAPASPSQEAPAEAETR